MRGGGGSGRRKDPTYELAIDKNSWNLYREKMDEDEEEEEGDED